MVFTTISFLFFLLIVLGVYWSLPSDRWRHPFLFVANFFFYGWWNWKFTSLLFFVILISYVAGQWVQQAEKNLALKKAVMMMACALLIGMPLGTKRAVLSRRGRWLWPLVLHGWGSRGMGWGTQLRLVVRVVAPAVS
jgi:D-alanyl-lipoteichoic acid acyltransferase DltB (MBOAT superfamily)